MLGLEILGLLSRLSVGLVLLGQGSFLGWSWRVWGQQNQRGAEVGDSTCKAKKTSRSKSLRCCFLLWLWKSHSWCVLEAAPAVGLGFLAQGAAQAPGNVQPCPWPPWPCSLSQPGASRAVKARACPSLPPLPAQCSAP